MTEILCIIDRSGSMEPLRADTIGGFNSFLAEQKKQSGKALLTLVLFDHELRTVHDGVDLQAVQPLDDTSYVPRGGTALLDAIGVGIARAGNRPGQKIVCILTDGQENSSREYRLDQIRQMIRRCQDELGWTFIFLSADQAAFTTASQLAVTSSSYFQRSPDGVTGAFGEISQQVSSSRRRMH